jgi:hypothetical protein
VEEGEENGAGERFEALTRLTFPGRATAILCYYTSIVPGSFAACTSLSLHNFYLCGGCSLFDEIQLLSHGSPKRQQFVFGTSARGR